MLWAEQNGKGLDFNGIENGMMMQKKSIKLEIDGHANHPKYDFALDKKITQIIADAGGNNVKALADIRKLIEKTKKTLKDDVLLGTKNVNDVIDF